MYLYPAVFCSAAGENYIYYLENGSTGGEKYPGPSHNH